MSNSELEDELYNLNYGDDPNLPYYGHNFNIIED